MKVTISYTEGEKQKAHAITALFYAIEDGVRKAMKDLNAVSDDALTYSKEYKAASQ